jgi:carbon-monoxide dehydrogenase small subunit
VWKDQAASSSAAGISALEVHPVQAAFAACHGLQCGFCTPGMIMASTDLLRRHPDPSDEQILEGLAGNLCRCTGYVNIVKAVKQAAAQMRESLTARSSR